MSLKVGDIIRDFLQYYDSNSEVTARTPHGTYRFEITYVEDGDYGGPCLVLKEIVE